MRNNIKTIPEPNQNRAQTIPQTDQYKTQTFPKPYHNYRAIHIKTIPKLWTSIQKPCPNQTNTIPNAHQIVPKPYHHGAIPKLYPSHTQIRPRPAVESNSKKSTSQLFTHLSASVSRLGYIFWYSLSRLVGVLINLTIALNISCTT